MKMAAPSEPDDGKSLFGYDVITGMYIRNKVCTYVIYVLH